MIMFLFLTGGVLTLASIMAKGGTKNSMDAFCDLECKSAQTVKHRFCC